MSGSRHVLHRTREQVHRFGGLLRERGRKALLRTLRLTGAAVAAYVVAALIFPGTVPVIAALTALLVVEVTLFDMVTSGVQRVTSVVVGVLLAVGFSSVVGISWWSLGLLVAVSILAGQFLRLGPHLVEVPISAMLVLAVGGDDSVATDRIVETFVGAAVGVAVNLLFPPRIRADTAADAVGGFADEMAALLARAGSELLDRISFDEAAAWLDRARRLSRHVPRIDRALGEASRSRRLNPRALVQGDTTQILRNGLEALEHSSVAVRSMFRSIADEVHRRPGAAADDAAMTREALAVLLGELADAVRAYGDLVRAEVRDDTRRAQDAVLQALAALAEARARVIDLRLVDSPSDAVTWALNEAILEAAERVLAELDIDAQVRRRTARPITRVDPRPLLRAAQDRLRAGTEQLAGHPLYQPPPDD